VISKKLRNIIREDKKYLFQNYGDRLPVSFVRGSDSYLFDQDGKRYIDFFSGIAVCNLGYNKPQFSRMLHKQLDRILHTSNWYFNPEQIEAAKLISQLSFPGKTLFVNSGTEANEAAIKLARRYGKSISSKRYQIISFKGSFHGRTYGGMSATGQEKTRKGFEPLVPGFKILPFNDISAFRKEIEKNGNVAAVITELIQGEGGINIAEKAFVDELLRICRKNNILTIIDEIQTGIGRTGKHFAYQHYNFKPDIITIAKGLGNGIPIGAIHTRDELATYLDRGSHGTTFGGNHLACAAAVSVLSELKKKRTMTNIKNIRNYLIAELKQIKERVSLIREIRGMGLHIGIELAEPGMDIVKIALENGLVINCTFERIIRIMPPLNISLKTAREGMNILKKIFLERVAQN
jgi:acetylornithine/N-succinyldiaminopimelate aminotransferase